MTNTTSQQPGRFPDQFLFGTATAAYQVEGGVDEGGRGRSIWDTFSHTPGKTYLGHTGDVTINHYHRLESDLDIIAELGVDAYRFSIAWSRIQPSGRGPANEAGVDFYNRLIDGLLARGIAPVATLYHWDLPQVLDDEGGWLNRETAFAFAEYARIAGEAFGDRVAIWTTLNEPWCAAFLGYGAGNHAPGHTDERESLIAAHHLNLAHGLGIAALRSVVSNPAAQFSVTLNLHWLVGEGEHADEAVRQIDAVANRIFTGPMLRGEYPQDLIDDTASLTDWSFVLDGDLELIHQPIDVLGVNYYYTEFVTIAGGPEATGPTPWAGARQVTFVKKPGPQTTYGWTVDPEGLVDLLRSLSEQFPGLPLMVTENGAAFPDAPVTEDGIVRIHDDARTDYLASHFTSALKALDEGIDLRGYFVWSLFDNFEWDRGYEVRFGLVRVDYETQERIWKDSAYWYRALVTERTMP